MRKASAVFLCLLMVTLCVQEITAKENDHTESDGNGNIVTDLPWNQEIEGKMYGQLIGKVKDDDIDIDVPAPEDKEDPVSPEEPDTGTVDNGGEGGNKEENSKPSRDPNNAASGEQGTSAIRNFYPNITAANQQRYGIQRNGTDKNGRAYYKWEEKAERLTIYPALFEKAKEEQKNIVMRVVDRSEGKMHYRLRLLYSDIKDMKETTLDFEFGAKCSHKEAMYEMSGTNDIVYLLQCEQAHVSIPVYIGIGVPASWDHAYGVYQYSVEQRDLVYIRKDLQIDEENIIEVRMAPGKDYVFSQRSLPVEEKSLNTWVSGLVGGSRRVDQKLALGSTAMFAAAGFLGVSLVGGLYLKKSGKGSRVRKRRKES